LSACQEYPKIWLFIATFLLVWLCKVIFLTTAVISNVQGPTTCTIPFFILNWLPLLFLFPGITFQMALNCLCLYFIFYHFYHAHVYSLNDMNYLLKFVACSKLVDNLIEYFEPTGAINTITMNEKNNLNRKLFWLTKWLSKVLQIKTRTSVLQ